MNKATIAAIAFLAGAAVMGAVLHFGRIVPLRTRDAKLAVVMDTTEARLRDVGNKESADLLRVIRAVLLEQPKWFETYDDLPPEPPPQPPQQ